MQCTCGKEMRVRQGKTGEFWGCSGYPTCKHTVNIEDELRKNTGDKFKRDVMKQSPEQNAKESRISALAIVKSKIEANQLQGTDEVKEALDYWKGYFETWG